MLHAAAQAISAAQPMSADRPRLLAVTLLTSIDQKAMREVGLGGTPQARVLKLAQLAKKAGVDGVVASVKEARAIRKACGRDFLIVTPGVRPKEKGAAGKADDQARTATPAEAIRAGISALAHGDILVIAGKGHETGQIVGSEVRPFSDRDEAIKAALSLGGRVA